MLATFVIFKKLPQVNSHPMGEKLSSGHPVGQTGFFATKLVSFCAID
jgi:hypothetical protein